MGEPRYDIRNEPHLGGWTVFDIFTGWPAVVDGVAQTGLDMEQADDLVDLLNTLNVRRRAES